MNLPEIRDRIATLPTLTDKLSGINARLAAAEAEVADLLSRYEKEKRDVANMEKDSFTNFILRTFDKFDEKAEREQQEEVEAKLRYDRARMACESLRDEKECLAARIKEIEGLSAQYVAQLNAKREEVLRDLGGEAARRLIALEEVRADILSQMTEVAEAMTATQSALETATLARDALSDAEGWANWDLVGGRGFLSHALKYSKLNTAEGYFHQLSAQLHKMRSELEDVRGIALPELESISGAWQMADFFFDNIFVDLSVRSKIVENGQRVEQLMSGIRTVQESLSAKQAQLTAALHDNDRHQEDTVVSAG